MASVWPSGAAGSRSAVLQQHPAYGTLLRCLQGHCPALGLAQLRGLAQALRQLNARRGSSHAADGLLEALAAAAAARLSDTARERQPFDGSAGTARATASSGDASVQASGHAAGQGGHWAEAESRDGAFVLHALVKLGWGCGDLTEAVAASACRSGLAERTSPVSLTDLTWALGKLEPRHRAGPAAEQLLRQLRTRLAQPGLLEGLSPVGLSMVLYGLGRVGDPLPPPLLDAACRAAAAAAASGRSSPQALANTAWALARLCRGDAEGGPRVRVRGGGLQHDVLGALASAAAPQLHRFSPQELANLLAALAGLGALRGRPDMLAAAQGRLLQLLRPASAVPEPAAAVAAGWPQRGQRQQVGLQDLCDVLYALATSAPAAAAHGSVEPEAELIDVGYGSGCASAPAVLPRGVATDSAVAVASQFRVQSELLVLLAERCAALLPRSTPYQTTTIAWAFARLGGAPQQPLLTGITQSLLEGVAAAAAAPGGDGHGDGVERPGAERAAPLPPARLAQLMWAMAKMRAPLPRAVLLAWSSQLATRTAEFDPQVGVPCAGGLV